MPIYDESRLGTPANQITFNDFDTSPIYRVVRRAPNRRELVEFDIKLPDNLGVADFQTLIGKTYFVIEGIMYPNDDNEFYQGRRALRKVGSLTVEQADNNADLGYVPYIWNEETGRQMFVKVLYVDMQEATRQGIAQPFRILCKIKYPVIFSEDTRSSTIGVIGAGLSTGIGYPFHYPVAYGATTYSQDGSIANAGDIPAYPSAIQIFGPINTPRITNTSTGEFIELSTDLATVNDSVIIAYNQDSVSITKNGNSVLNSLTSASTLFKLRVGTNDLTLSGATLGTGAYATISSLDTWPLS